MPALLKHQYLGALMNVQGELKSNGEPVNWSITITVPKYVSSKEMPSMFKCLKLSKNMDSDLANQNVHHASYKAAVIFWVASSTREQNIKTLKTTQLVGSCKLLSE